MALEAELEQNPILSPLEEEEENPDTEQLEIETAEFEEDVDSPPEKELDFEDQSFEILRQIEEEYRDHFAQNENFSIHKNSEEEKLRSFIENSITSSTNLFEALIKQAQEAIEDEQERQIAEILIGSLDHNGFLNSSLEEIAELGGFDLSKVEEILKKIQTFEPDGVGAKNLQESLLIQLRRKGKEQSIAFQIIDRYYDDMVQNRIPLIAKGLGYPTEKINQEIQEEIAKLDLHPGTRYECQPPQYIIPDAAILNENENLKVVVNEDFLPRIHLNVRYMKMLMDPAIDINTKEFIKTKLSSAKWLMRNIFQRNDTIERITSCLVKHQKDFFLNPNGQLTPMTMKMVSEELNLHESTVARAVANKYIDTPRGLFPLRFFFSVAYTNGEGVDISSKTVRNLLEEIIQKEDPHHPLSDEAISAELKRRGIPCARRTIAKYRAAMQLGNAHQRKKF